MKKTKPTKSNNTRFWASAIAVLLLAASLSATTWPYLLQATRYESAQLTTSGHQGQGSDAQLDFQLARYLDPHNQNAVIGLAKLQIQAGQTATALQILQSTEEGREVLRLKLRAQLELAQTDAALASANRLVTQAPTQDDFILATLTYELANRGDLAQKILPQITTPEALQHVQRIQSHNAPLGAELYATGLVRSAQRFLMKQPDSLTRSLILGRIDAAHSDHDSQTTARDFYRSATNLDPTSQEARQGLIDTSRALGDTTEADAQSKLLTQLKAGRP